MNLLSIFLLLFSVSAPEGGKPVFPSDLIGTIGKIVENPHGTFKRVEPEDEATREKGFSEILRCEITSQPPGIWAFSYVFRVPVEIQKDEVLLVRFYARTVYAKTETGIGLMQPFFELAGPPHTKSLDRKIELSREWKEYVIPFRSVDSYDAEGSSLGIFLGFQEQIIEIAELQLLSYGTDFDIKKIPDTIPKYRGQEPDAPWRTEANKRIDQHRKGDLELTVLDSNGNPVADADVEICMKRHAFGWGSAVTVDRILQEDEDGKRYRKIIERYFNRVVFENDLKFWAWQNPHHREKIYQASDWLKERNIDIRGHVLVWPSWRNSPKHLEEWTEEPEKIRQYFRDHIKDEVTGMKGRLIDWDVVNEPYDNRDISKILGGKEVVEWFKLARQYDPDTKLYLNDYGILSAEGLDVKHHDYLEDIFKYLLKNKAPIDGIGFQGHFGTQATPPDKLLEILDRFGKLGLAISITEHDIATKDEEYQADFTRDFLTTVFSHSSVEAILIWGFWEKAHWVPDGAYYRADWSIKPAGQAWIDLVMKKWWTEIDAKTNEDGKLSVRGFLGDYEITVRKDGKDKTIKTAIPKDGLRLKIKLAE